ncbi:unnamed protein product [Rhizophagus irregularis]|nr:unnamed protein product [Rhizophagus irregularis]
MCNDKLYYWNCVNVMEKIVKDKDQKPKNNSNKRPHTPDTDEGNKKPKFNIPEAEDPMEEMELNPQKLNKGKKKIEYPKVKCMNCSREESTTNYINSLGICPKCDEKRVRLELTESTSCIKTCTICQLRMDDFESRSSGAIVCGEEYNSVLTIMNMKMKMKVEQDKFNKIFEKIQKYLNGEFKERLFFEYPKEKIKHVLDNIVPLEITNMITEHIKESNLTQTEPIKTIDDTIEWTEEIKQS